MLRRPLPCTTYPALELYVAVADLKFSIFLPLPSKCLGYGYTPPCLPSLSSLMKGKIQQKQQQQNPTKI